jgi:hypothetical protein
MEQNTFNSFGELLSANTVPENKQITKYFDTSPVPEAQESPVVNAESVLTDASVENMTQVEPGVQVADSKVRAKFKGVFVGCRQREYEAPHVTIRMPDERIARLLISTGQVMDKNTKVDSDIIEAVQADMKRDINKYIANWNENNADHAIPLKQEKQNELPKKDESYKETAWYREQQRIQETTEKSQG